MVAASVTASVSEWRKRPITATTLSSALTWGCPPCYWLDLRDYDPVSVARTFSQPLLILQGERDYQVTTVDFKRWQTGLAGRPDVTFKLYPQLNHLFIAGEGKGNPAEYDEPGHVAAAVVADIAAWIRDRKTVTVPR